MVWLSSIAALVDRELDAAEHPHLEAGRGHHDVGVELLARAQRDPALGERLDVIGDDRGAARLDRREQIAVRHEADALIPHGVARREVLHVEVGADLFAHLLEQPAPHRSRHESRDSTKNSMPRNTFFQRTNA